MTTTPVMPPGLVSNLQQALSNRIVKSQNDGVPSADESGGGVIESVDEPENDSRPVLLVTNSDGIESPGLSYLVQALVALGNYSVHVVAPQSDKSTSGHSVSLKETVEVASVEVNGAVAYEVSGTPVDCVSLALSGALFSWSKPILVISGINKGSSCGHHMFFSGVVAGAREALINGVPSISISLDWKNDTSKDSDFKDAVEVCMPLINATIRDVEKGVYPTGLSLNVEVPKSPMENKGIKVTKPSLWRSNLSWKAISGTRNKAAARFAGGQPGLGFQFAQLGRDASAAGAARRLSTQKKNLEIVESVGVSGKSNFERTVKYFRAEMVEKEQQEEGEDLDFRALENGYLAISLLPLSARLDPEKENAAVEWISSALKFEQ